MPDRNPTPLYSDPKLSIYFVDFIILYIVKIRLLIALRSITLYKIIWNKNNRAKGTSLRIIFKQKMSKLPCRGLQK
jgi:hypothetical protein